MATTIRMTVDPKDLKNLQNKIAELNSFEKNTVFESFTHAANQTVGRMKKDAPVDTGRLRREVEYVLTSKGITIGSEAIDPDTGKDYAPEQEFGTREFPAHPYFYRNIRGFLLYIMKDLKRKLNNITKKRF